MEEVKQAYKVEYDNFVRSFQKGTTSGEDVGVVITRQVQYFSEANMEYASALKAFNKVAAEIENSVDDNMKPISSAKAKVKADATLESDRLIDAKANLTNIEAIVNGLKSLQRGILSEQNFSGGL